MEDARHFMPKGRMSLGISNAQKLGLLDEGTASSLKLLVEIRNTFAHGILSNVTFQTTSVLAKVNKLSVPNLSDVPEVLTEINNNPRRRFLLAVDNMFFTLNEVKNGVPRLPGHAAPRLAITRVPPSSTDSEAK